MIDLHVHTNCSDGYLSPKDLIKLAAAHGVKTIAITDHDTVRAYNSDIMSFAAKFGVKIIPGIEFSTIDKISQKIIHVVGLNIDTNNPKLLAACEKCNISRQNYLLSIKDKLKQVGIVVRDLDLLKSGSTITISNIARDIITNPVNHITFLKKYSKIPTTGQFVKDFLGKGKPAFVSNDDKLYTNQAIDIVKQAGGKAICAHPSLSVMYGYDFELMKRLILRNKFDGIETINIQYDKINGDKRFDMVKEFTEFAKDNDLLTSGGSDFHGDDQEILGNHSELGLTNEDYKITNQQLAAILSV